MGPNILISRLGGLTIKSPDRWLDGWPEGWVGVQATSWLDNASFPKKQQRNKNFSQGGLIFFKKLCTLSEKGTGGHNFSSDFV